MPPMSFSQFLSQTVSSSPEVATNSPDLLPATPVAGSILGNLHSFGTAVGFGSADIRLVMASLIRTSLGFVAIIFLMILLASGAQWMFAGPNDEAVASAKRGFVNAFIGIILIMLSYSIVSLIVTNLNTAFTSTPTL